MTQALQEQLLRHPDFWEELARIQDAQGELMREVSDALRRNNAEDLQVTLHHLIYFAQINGEKINQFQTAFESFTESVFA